MPAWNRAKVSIGAEAQGQISFSEIHAPKSVKRIEIYKNLCKSVTMKEIHENELKSLKIPCKPIKPMEIYEIR